MKRFVLALCFLFASAASAQNVVRIKLGTLAPQGSTWHQLLMQMAADFARESQGKVELKVYAGGTQGSEGEMIRKISIGQLQAASMTSVGLHEITPEPQVEDVPFMIDSYEEYDFVHARVVDKLDAAIARKGFAVLQWGEVGFVHLFSTQPYRTPVDFGQGKVFTWNGDPGAEQAWKAAGFRPVVLSSTDMIPSLSSGMINIVSEPPLYAYTTALYQKANNMLDLNWGFLTGATVVKKDVWDKIDPALQKRLLEIAVTYEKKVRADVRKQSEDAVVEMKKRGLTVNEPADIQAWQKSAAAAEAVVRQRVPGPFFDEFKKARDEFRAQHKR
jgi:TRAP-type C4-dicarboxylate transport system substrate-binding protein